MSQGEVLGVFALRMYLSFIELIVNVLSNLRHARLTRCVVKSRYALFMFNHASYEDMLQLASTTSAFCMAAESESTGNVHVTCRDDVQKVDEEKVRRTVNIDVRINEDTYSVLKIVEEYYEKMGTCMIHVQIPELTVVLTKQ